MTTALPHRLRYRLSAATTTAVTVVPSAAALSTAARHTSSGMRSERGIVAMSGTTDAGADLGASTGTLTAVREGPQHLGTSDVALGLGGVRVPAHVADDLRGAGGDPVCLGLRDGVHRVLRGLGLWCERIYIRIYMSTPNPEDVTP